MDVSIYRIIGISWLVMFLIWVLTSFSLKDTARSRSEGPSRIAVYIVWAGWWLLFSHGFRLDPLSRRVLEPSISTAYVGLAITEVGLAFAILARIYIGRNWSPLIQVKQGHELIQRGPYAVVRHPIYSGLMLATLGTAIAYGELSGFMGFVMIVVAWGYKSRLEEEAMAEQFGGQYEKYRSHVKALIPFVW
jgi:protein-S-isoprenylcysteine O-methyltransferase Ste14